MQKPISNPVVKSDLPTQDTHKIVTEMNYFTQPQAMVQMRSRTPIGIYSKFDFSQDCRTSTPVA